MRWDAARECWASSYVPAQAPNWAGRRQTVAAGPVSTAGLPTFLPTSSVSLNLPTQNLSGSAVMVVAAANGWITTNGRPNDLIAYLSANVAWLALTASRAAATPNYLYMIVNADGSTTRGATILPPIYQEGGVPSTTSDQITFNIGEMKCYLGNGASAPQINLVLVGEAATDGSTVTGTVAYAYNGRFDSGFTSTLPSGGVAVPKSHNIGAVPTKVDFRIRNLTTDAGWDVGDETDLARSMDTTAPT